MRRPMQPYYTIMRLPGESEPEFIQMLPFTPRSRDNLAAWLAARSDGEHYGTLRVFQFPKQKVIFGPRQVVARISQDQTISPQITLWNQQGSQVIWGTLMVIPIEESLIYVRPLYLRASGRPHSRAHAGDRRLPESDRDGADAGRRRWRGSLAVRRPGRNPTSSWSRTRRPLVGSVARCGPTGARRRHGARPALAARARGHYDRAVEAQRKGDWAQVRRRAQAAGRRARADARRDKSSRLRCGRGSVSSHARSTSATLHACAMQPRAV